MYSSTIFDLLHFLNFRRIPNLSASWTPRPELVSREQCDWHNGSIGHRDIQVKVNVISQCGITVENMFNVSTKNIGK